MKPPLTDPARYSSLPDAGAAFFCDSPGLGLLAISGPDAEVFLQGQLSSDILQLTAGTVQLSSYNSAKGRMLATLFIWRDGTESFRALVAAELAEPLRKRLSMYVLRSKVTLADIAPAHVLFGVGGARPADAVRAAVGVAPDAARVLTGETATVVALPDGRMVIVAPIALADSLRNRLVTAAVEGPSEIWRWLGIRAGVPTIGAATQDLFVPQTTNWDLLGGVNFHKGCYPGQEIIARTQYLGRLKERMYPFHVDGASPSPGTKVYGTVFGDQACGTVVDAAPAPVAGSDLLAVLQVSALDGQLHLGTPDGPTLAPLPLPYLIPASVAAGRPKL